MIPQYKPSYSHMVKNNVLGLLDSGSFFSEFKENEKFEKELASFTEADYVVTCTSGTMAITLALLSVGVQPGDEVIVPNVTMIATANAVKVLGATPVFCDIEPSTGCLDCHLAEKLITPKTKAIIYVTLNGRMNVPAIRQLYSHLKFKNIALIKDDAQSLGSYTELRVSLQSPLFGDLHTTSFSHYKLISTGQGGAILTSSLKHAENLKRLKNHGRLEGGDDIHNHFGVNSKFSDLLAAVGRGQLVDIQKVVQKKKDIYDTYYKSLKNLPDIFMYSRQEYHLPWMVDIYTKTRMSDRDELYAFLFMKDIQTRKMYPVCNQQMCYSVEGEFPESKNFSRKGLWLPSSPSITIDEIETVCKAIREFYENK